MEFQTYNMLEPGFFPDSSVEQRNNRPLIILSLLLTAGIAYLIYERELSRKQDSEKVI